MLKSRLLRTAATPQEVRTAIKQCKGFGKELPADFYVHQSCIEKLPPVLKQMWHTACKYAGPQNYTLIKFSKMGNNVTLLNYPDFDTNPHPGIASSVRVDLTTGQTKAQSYNQDNPPILHRKETFVAPDYPGADKFRALTAQEEAAGLLNRRDIGYRQRWEDFLRTQGYAIKGYKLVKA